VLWLLLFLAIFGALAVISIKFLVPHHFNDRIAVLISALLSGIILIALRARASKPAAHR